MHTVGARAVERELYELLNIDLRWLTQIDDVWPALVNITGVVDGEGAH